MDVQSEAIYVRHNHKSGQRGWGMNLKGFLTETIVEIMEGLQAAQQQVSGDALINPLGRGHASEIVADGEGEGLRHIYTRWNSMSRSQCPAGQKRKLVPA